MFSQASIKLVTSSPLGGGTAPAASASARAAATDCETEQMPQMRGTITRASSGSRPGNICSKPRYMVAVTSARCTWPCSTVSCTSRSPSTRLNGPTSKRVLLSLIYFNLVRRTTGATTMWSAVALFFTRLGVALLDREASATNQALGMSVGRPIGMPASLGVA